MLIGSRGNYQFTNFEQLESVLEDKVRDALDMAKEIAINELIDIINKSVYKEPEGWYKRTGDLAKRENWVGKVYKGMHGYTLEINFEPNIFSYESSDLQHASITGGNENRIDPLALIGILNGNGGLNLETNLSHWGIEHEAFWDKFEWWFHDNFTTIYKECLRELRVPIK